MPLLEERRYNTNQILATTRVSKGGWLFDSGHCLSPLHPCRICSDSPNIVEFPSQSSLENLFGSACQSKRAKWVSLQTWHYYITMTYMIRIIAFHHSFCLLTLVKVAKRFAGTQKTIFIPSNPLNFYERLCSPGRRSTLILQIFWGNAYAIRLQFGADPQRPRAR